MKSQAQTLELLYSWLSSVIYSLHFQGVVHFTVHWWLTGNNWGLLCSYIIAVENPHCIWPVLVTKKYVEHNEKRDLLVSVYSQFIYSVWHPGLFSWTHSGYTCRNWRNTREAMSCFFVCFIFSLYTYLLLPSGGKVLNCLLVTVGQANKGNLIAV